MDSIHSWSTSALSKCKPERALLHAIGWWLLGGVFSGLWAQEGTFRTSAALGGYASTSQQTPFWLRANQWGQVPQSSPAGSIRLGTRYQSPGYFNDSTRRSPIGWETGGELVKNFGSENRLLLPEAYAKVHWKKWELMAGRERNIIGLVDSTLSSGSYSWSGNALPIPLLRFGLREYLPLGFLKNFVSIKGTYVHGWFNDSYIQGAYFHQKTLYGRFGKPESSFHVQLGIVHNVTWGGSADYLQNDQLAINGKLTTNFGDYLTGVVLGRIPSQKSNSRFTPFDGTNRVGNHVGHYDLAVNWELPHLRLSLYRQHPFEDASGLQIQNLPDGLYGISMRQHTAPSHFFTLKGITLEFLYTKDQSGGSFDLTGSRFKGVDNYFNHAQYKQGWSYLSHGIGTPFIPAQPTVILASTTGEYFPTNQTILYHAALEGILLRKIHVLTKLSYSLNSGTINGPFPSTIRQFSSLLSLDAPLLRWGNTRLAVQMAYDTRGIYPQSLGGYLGIRSDFNKGTPATQEKSTRRPGRL